MGLSESGIQDGDSSMVMLSVGKLNPTKKKIVTQKHVIYLYCNYSAYSSFVGVIHNFHNYSIACLLDEAVINGDCGSGVHGSNSLTLEHFVLAASL